MKCSTNVKNYVVLTVILFFISVSMLDLYTHKAVETASAINQPISITVSAAASLKQAIEDLKINYEQQQSQVRLSINYGSSGSLQQQIEQGAPVDVFISAANKQMDALAKKDLIQVASRKVLLKNKLVLVVPKNSNKITRFADLNKDSVTKVALGEPVSVPAGKYAKEALTSFNLWDSVESKAVYGKDVRQVLNWVETGNVDAGLTYYSDALFSTKAKMIAIASEESHAPISYPIAVLKDSKAPKEAADFVHFLLTPEAKGIFEKYGFIFVGK